MSDVEISKRLSYVLRHRPDSIGISWDAAGWVAVDDLLPRLALHGDALTREVLERIVAHSDKRRFEFSADGHRIRASQGHSQPVELGYAPAEPPVLLYHGTVAPALEAILREGLRPGSRHHVHLSSDRRSAVSVGARRGKPIILLVHTPSMRQAGQEFFCSTNGVWLTAHVPPSALAVEPASGLGMRHEA